MEDYTQGLAGVSMAECIMTKVVGGRLFSTCISLELWPKELLVCSANVYFGVQGMALFRITDIMIIFQTYTAP